MGALFVQCCKGLLEPVPALEIACSGLGRVEFVGMGMGCFVLYRNTIGPDGEPERHICGRVFAPLETIPPTVELMLRASIEAGLASAATISRRLLM